MGWLGWMKFILQSELRSHEKTSRFQMCILDCEEILFGLLPLVEKGFGDASRLNFLVDSETQALVGFVIFQQTHLLFASVTIYTTVDQPPPKKNGRH